MTDNTVDALENVTLNAARTATAVVIDDDTWNATWTGIKTSPWDAIWRVTQIAIDDVITDVLL